MKTFTKAQPKAGETILHCGHVEGSLHWFQYEQSMQFMRPDGSHGEAAWFVACDACFIRHGEAVTHFVRGDGIWTGDAPAIERSLPS